MIPFGIWSAGPALGWEATLLARTGDGEVLRTGPQMPFARPLPLSGLQKGIPMDEASSETTGRNSRKQFAGFRESKGH